ncbi:hypothetical protein JW935_19930 [candidate division KSB1 bacterium]|nr:hypothetical protein [candidate division KSB1 bacterium]
MRIISGISPGPSGTGRLMAQLLTEAADMGQSRPAFHFTRFARQLREPFDRRQYFTVLKNFLKIYKARLFKPFIYRRAVMDDEHVVLIHFQTIGAKTCLKFIQKRKKPVWLYLLDAGFFCLRSYNHIPQENQACLRCLGGRWECAGLNHCQPSPISDAFMADFLGALKKWVKEGKVKLLVQNRKYVELAERHFGTQVTIKQLGLWTTDFNIEFATSRENFYYDVVYHGSQHPAKGALWAVKLANLCSDLTFLFPFSREKLPGGISTNNNLLFKPLTWENGLAEAVKRARCVLVPSLWSAPIEGALVKSIVTGSAVAVVDEPTAFAQELPGQLVLKLPQDVAKAAVFLTDRIKEKWFPAERVRQEWFDLFKQNNARLLHRLIQVISQ